MALMCRSLVSQGVGRRYAHVVLRKADIDLNKRAGELTEEEVSAAAQQPADLNLFYRKQCGMNLENLLTCKKYTEAYSCPLNI